MNIARRYVVRAIGSLLICGAIAAVAGCGEKKSGNSNEKHVRIGVVGDFNAQWDHIKSVLAAENIKIELVKFSDYATPNRALSDKELDLNAFQHIAFLKNDVKQHGYKLTAIGNTVVAPLRIYNNKSKIRSISDITDGDKIGIPGDLTNGGRALKLLEAAGLIKVDPAKGYVPTKADITEYVKKIQIIEAESGMLANLLPDFSACIINGGNAFTAGLNPQDAIFSEQFDAADPYLKELANVIVARTEDRGNPIYKRIVEVYQTPETARIIKEAYKGGYIPAWIKDSHQ